MVTGRGESRGIGGVRAGRPRATSYLPDMAVLPEELLEAEGALSPDRTLLVVEVTSPSNADADRTVKRRRYAQFGAPPCLLVDRVERTCTRFSQPGEPGCARVQGPHPFGVA
ncbi:Uma2 family endonuclease [Kitasatospora sp. NPDC127059]|uniref:Uma2 family endonuclease n=1 Tax=unclassified Kitasatospora TaxID=2633591 RepID=UPI00365A183E